MPLFKTGSSCKQLWTINSIFLLKYIRKIDLYSSCVSCHWLIYIIHFINFVNTLLLFLSITFDSDRNILLACSYHRNNHTILALKIYAYGIESKIYDCVYSFLKNRSTTLKYKYKNYIVNPRVLYLAFNHSFYI